MKKYTKTISLFAIFFIPLFFLLSNPLSEPGAVDDCSSTNMGGDYTVSTSCAFAADNTVTTVADSSTNANTGTPTGTTIVTGKYGSARSFNGSSDYVEIAGYNGIGGTNTRTATAWVKTSSATAQAIMSWGEDTTGNKYIIRVDSTNGNVLRVEVNGGYEYGSTNLADGQWHHIAVVLPSNSSNVTDHIIYVDGVQESTTILSQAMDTSITRAVQIGSDHTSRFINGVIDDVRIYDYARSANQVIEDMNNRTASTGNNPVAHWKMDDGYISGVDNGDLTVAAGNTLTVNAGQTVVWNPGKGIDIENTGSIAISTSGQLKQGYLWVADSDTDGWYYDSTQVVADSQPTGYVRRKDIMGSIFGDGSDGAVTFNTNTNINSDTIASGRTVSDGINHDVSAIGTNTVTTSSMMDTIKLTSTNIAAANAYTYWKVLSDNTTLATNDTFEYDVYLNTNLAALGGIDIKFTDTSYARSVTWTDQNGVSCHPGSDITSYANSVWYHRKCTVPAGLNGKTISYIDIVNEIDTGTTITAYYDNFIVKNSSGIVKTTIHTQGAPDYNTVDIQSNAGNAGSATNVNCSSEGLSSCDTPGGITAGDNVLLINLQGDTTNYGNVGKYELLKVDSVSDNVLTFTTDIKNIYGATTLNSNLTGQKVMIQRVPQYSNVTINDGVTVTGNTWDGTKGGVIAMKANGTVTMNSDVYGAEINMAKNGYRGGDCNGCGDATWGDQGEGIKGLGTGSLSANGNGGGGGYGPSGYGGDPGAGGGHASAGGSGAGGGGTAIGGSAVGEQTLGTTFMGGGAGAGGDNDSFTPLPQYVSGGGIIMLFADTISSFYATVNGEDGVASGNDSGGVSGSGAGGSILVKGRNVTLSTVTATGGAGASDSGDTGGVGSVGRIAIYYASSLSGTTSPSAYSSQVSDAGSGVYLAEVVETTPNRFLDLLAHSFKSLLQ